MRILVCVKQVPGTTNVEVDPVTGVIKRDGAAAKLNPYDLFALEMAMRLKEEFGGSVETLTMGPPQAEAALLETVYMGADHAYLLSDRAFAGSDVHATSYALSCGIRKAAAMSGEYDLILCGKQTTDGDTAQVGPETAEWLGIDHASNVVEVRYCSPAEDEASGQQAVLSSNDLDDGYVDVRMNMDDCFQTQRMELPCLVTVEKDVVTPRLPSYRRKKEIPASSEVISVFSAADLGGLDPEKCGLKGSPTKVEKIFPPEKNAEKNMYTGTAKELSDRLLSILKDGKYI